MQCLFLFRNSPIYDPCFLTAPFFGISPGSVSVRGGGVY